ncbi:hypothetical protein F5Y19DRAFT_471094 [Xylariaceae sp. FL1651]|nr:hypothetical protein F5Y19DRAFT_471094 [Xylariaceae sp. FL1651]
MHSRLFGRGLPTPLHTANSRRRTVRDRVLDEDETDERPPSPKQRAYYSIRPIFDKCPRRKNDDDASVDQLRNRRRIRASPPPAPESPLVKNLTHNYAALRVTLHSNAVTDFEKAQENMTLEMDKKIDANLLKLSEIDNEAQQLSASHLDLEVETQISDKSGQQRTSAVSIRIALSRYQKREALRTKELIRLWSSWERVQANIGELSNTIKDVFERDPPNETRGISSSHREWIEQEDVDIGHRSKEVVEEMTACEDDLQEKLEDEAANVAKAILNQ